MPFAFTVYGDDQIEGFPPAYSVSHIETQAELPDGAIYYDTEQELQFAIDEFESQWAELVDENTGEIVSEQDENVDAVLKESDIDGLFSKLKLPSEQPENAGFWLNEGVLTFWNGEQNKTLDFNEGTNKSVFGSIVGDV